jgi:osmoprotectant transport system permease protein
LHQAYGLIFADINIIELPDEQGTFAAMTNDEAQLGICRVVNSQIHKDSFASLDDDKQFFDADTPSPVIRAEVLDKAPGIAGILNKLAPQLSVPISAYLQGQIGDGQSVRDVAYDWLKKQGLISAPR